MTRASSVMARALVLAVLIALFWFAGRAVEDQLSLAKAGVDDANIYFRYARNIADGLGCVWNPGGERVEGCTSLAWTALCVVGFLMTPTPERLLFVTNVVLAAVAAWIVVLRLAKMLDGRGGPRAALCAGLAVVGWVAASPGCVVWMTAALMDVALLSLALVLAWEAAIAWTERPEATGRRVALGLATSFLAVVRPEGLIASAVLLASVGLVARRSSPASVRRLAVPALSFVLVVAAVFVARRAYFGWWLPNTYYAKVDADLAYRLRHGVSYLASFSSAHLVAATAALAASVLAFVAPRRPAAVLAVAVLLAGVFNAVFVGGDFFGSWRILQPYWLLMLVPVVHAIARFAPLAKRLAWTTVLAVALSAAALLTGPVAWTRVREDSELHQSFLLVEYGRIIGDGFNRIFPPGARPVAGVVAGGALPFAYEGLSFDILGLNDVEVAHATDTRRGLVHGHGAFHAPTFFRRAPDVLPGLMRAAPIDAPRPPVERVPFADLGPEGDRLFDETYVPVAIGTEAWRPLGVMLPAWARREWLARYPDRRFLREIVPAGDGWTYR